MITWTEEDKAQLRGWRLGRKFLEYLRQSLPKIEADKLSMEQYAIKSAEKEGMMKQLSLIEGPMSTPVVNESINMTHADMSKD